MRRENIRIGRQAVRKLLPKRVTVSMNGFCKYGRVHKGTDTATKTVVITPIGGNQNNNWKIG